MDYLPRFKEYIKNIKTEDKIGIFYHENCGDGACASALTIKSLERILKRKVNFYFSNNHEINSKTLQYLKDNNITKAIFVDLSPSVTDKLKKEVEKITQLLILDHHIYLKDFNSDRTLFIHTTFIKPRIKGHFYPASKLVYDLFSDLVDLNDLDWLAAIGLISDMGYNKWKPFVHKVMKKYNIKIKKDVLKTELGKAVLILGTSLKFREYSDELFNELLNFKSYNDILQNKSMIKLYENITKETQYYINNREKSEKYKNLIIYEIKPKYPLGSLLSNRLSLVYFKNKTIILIVHVNSDPNMLVINARDQSGNVNTNKLIIEAINGLPDSKGGGHAPASGAKIRSEDLSKFKKQLIVTYDKLTKKI